MYEFTSINNGKNVLGVSRKTIETIINYPNNYTYCSGISMECRFYEDGKPLKESSPYVNPYLRPDIKGLDFYSLPPRKILALDRSFYVIAEFINSKEAALNCGLVHYYNVSRHINKMFINVIYNGKAMELLFAQNPLSKGGRKKVVLVNLDTNTPLLFKSIYDLTRYFGLDPKIQGGGSYLNKCILNQMVYRNSYRIYYLEEYKGPTPVPFKKI